MNILSKKISSFFLTSLSLMVCQASFSQSVATYSALPETMVSPPDQTPNILIIVDTSGSMMYKQGTTSIVDRSSPTKPKGGASPDSISYQVREAMRNVLSVNAADSGSLNIGIMAFGTNGLSGNNDLGTATDCKEYDGTDPAKGVGCVSGTGKNYRSTRKLTGYGTILENVQPLDATSVIKFNKYLATEPDYPFYTNNKNQFNGNSTYFANIAGEDIFNSNGNILNNGIIVSGGGTPTRGSLQTAAKYFNNPTGLSDDELISGLTINNPNPTPKLAAGEDPDDCLQKNYIFLITDGDPNGRPGESSFSNTNDRFESETNLIQAELKTLREEYGIQTLVFGYGLSGSPTTANSQQGRMQRMAEGGSTDFDAFLPSSTAELATALEFAFQSIKPKGGSSSGISVIASSSDAAGSVIQAIYSPEITGEEDDLSTTAPDDKINVSVAWTGTLSAYFLDKYGYLREDSSTLGTKGQLDSYDIDKAFRLGFDDDSQEVTVTRLNPINFLSPTFDERPETAVLGLDSLVPIWEAGDVLSQYPQNSTTVPPINLYSSKNRAYDVVASADNGYRRIYSWVQSNPGSTSVDSGNQIDFIYSSTPGSDNINPNNYTLLDTPTADEAKMVVDFIRGEEGISGLRNRTIDGQAHLLGDIVHSTAAQVDAPGENYDSRFSDSSYTQFKERYEFRRRMVYVGANDGLLHAFNGAFWDGEDLKFELSASAIGCESDCDDVEHEIGAEIWAYAPMNLLPQLRFLSSPSYDSSSHVSFVDGPVNVFDVQAFDPDETHVNGWGTIIVVGMRLGGGEYPDVDHDADADATDTFTARSAYVVIDVTDPSQEPVVIGEITHENLGFTTSRPSIMKEGDDWYLVFGSGPTDLTTTTSDQRARLFRYKLNHSARGFDADYSGTDAQAFGEPNSFVGDIVSHDWNGDFSDDAAYFGTAAGTEEASTGAIYRYVSQSHGGTVADKVNLMLDTDKPIVLAPLPKTISSQNWVLFGSGRYLTAKDAENEQQNALYGIREPIGNDRRRSYAEVASTSVLDVTNVEVEIDGDLVNSPITTEKTFAALKRAIVSTSTIGGWRYELPTSTGAPSSKASATPLSFRDLTFQTYYIPPVSDGNSCSNEFGESFVRVVDLVAGIPAFTPDFAGSLGNDGTTLTASILIGDGYAYESYVFIGPDPKDGKNRIIIKSPLSTGQIADIELKIPPGPNGRTSWREITIQ